MMKDDRENQPFWYVAWVSQATGFEGRGTVFGTRAWAQKQVDQANRETPVVMHWAACDE